MQRFEVAHALLASARAVRGDSISIATADATLAHSQGLHSEAVERWNFARRLGSKEPLASARLAANLRSLGDHSAAQSLIDAALAGYPDDVRILTEGARLAQTSGRESDAADLWRRAIRLAKPRLDWLQSYALCLMRTGDLDRAHRVIASARRQYPHCNELLALHGWIALERQDWQRAIALWTEHCRRSPDETTNREALGSAVHGAQMIGGSPVPAVRANIVTIYDEPTRNLLMGFESLGNGCEMGLVQRRFGAEPLGLLRWNVVDVENLIAALDHGFEGMGDPDNTAMKTVANGELFMIDRRWDLSMQTFVFADKVDPNEFYKKMCRRIVYLRDRLLENLRSAEKIFVYRSPVLPVDVIRRLHRSLRAHGPVSLLSVQPGRPVGEVEQLDEGLYIGFLARLGNVLGPECDIDFATWIDVFTKAQEKKRAADRLAPGVERLHRPTSTQSVIAAKAS